MISITVAYASPLQQKEIALQVEEGCTILQAVVLSNIATVFPEIIIPPKHVGIDGKSATLETKVKKGDRIEIYRELQRDPKQLRREKVSLKKKSRGIAK